MSKNRTLVGAVRPVIDQLEARTLLSGGDGGETWVIRGDASRRRPDDVIVVDVDPADAGRARAMVNGTVVGTHALAGLRTIEVGAGRGDDRVSVALGESSDVVVRVWGGFGNDVILGDGGRQAFYGGPGNDRLDAARGNDTLEGNDGHDDLVGGDGDDWANGNGGNDTIAGGEGMDRLFGEKGADRIDGGDGRDKIEAGKGYDTVQGGGGRDALAGSDLRDWVYLTAGHDTTDQDPDDRLRGDTSMLPLGRVGFDELRARHRQAAIDAWEHSFDKPAHLGGSLYGGWVREGLQGGWGNLDIVTLAGDRAVTASPGEGSYSGTNTQEVSVDEADLVETDGAFLFSIAGDELVITDARTLTVVYRRAIAGRPVGLYLIGDRLTVISAQSTWVPVALPPGVTPLPPGQTPGGADRIALAVVRRMPGHYEETVTLTVLDASDRIAPTVVEETTLDGTYVSSRAVADRVYTVVRNMFQAPVPHLVKVDEHTAAYESRESYIARLDAGLLDQAMAGFAGTAADGSASRGLLVGGGYDYAADAEVNTTWEPTLNVALLNVTDGQSGVVASTSVAGWGGQVYASGEALYLAQPTHRGGDERVDLFKFGLGLDAVPLQAAGQVDGRVLNSFSMDEEGEHFRIATTSGRGLTADNNVYVLDQVGDELRTVGAVEGIAPGEAIFAARFMGDRAYVITFEQTDPLWTIDLSDPTDPLVKGELVIPGFSSYLHPISETHLIGIGQGADRQVQVSLFDVSDTANPRRVDVYDVTAPGDWGHSAAQDDHHAFSYFPEHGVFAFPVHESGRLIGQRQRLQVFRVDPQAGFTDLGAVEQEGVILRSVRVGERLFAVGNRAITVVDIDDPDDEIGVIRLGDQTALPTT